MRTKLFALVAVVGMLGMAVGPGVAAAAQTDSGNETTDDSLSVSVDSEYRMVEVTKNDTDVANATVDVSADGNYSGTSTYTTNENGVAMLDEPSENVTIDVTATADNETASTSATLTVENGTNSGTFGLMVSNFVQSLQTGNQTAIGQQVAEFVTANNPGNAPDHAGPPEHAGPGDENESVNETDGERGPPEHAGNDTDEGPGADKGNGNANGNGNGNGNAGGPADDSDDEETETETETEA